MENDRYGYLPIIKRKELRWPGGARVALWVCPNIEYFHIDRPLPRASEGDLPDVPAYAARDYGSRIGVFRMMDVLDRHGIRASVMLNSDVCRYRPEIIEEGKKRNWEWLGHGVTNNLRMIDYRLEEERRVVGLVRETITAAVGEAPRGWLSPGLVETPNTPDHLAAEGFDYLADWGFDDQPIPMRVRSGRMIAVPFKPEISDISILMRQNRTPEQYSRSVCDQFDALYREGAEGGRVMAIPLHPFVIGLPFRIGYLDMALQYICSHAAVWRATGREIADWYYRHYYEYPGQTV